MTSAWQIAVTVQLPDAPTDYQIDTLTEKLPGYAVLSHSVGSGTLIAQFTLHMISPWAALTNGIIAAKAAFNAAFPAKPDPESVSIEPGED